MCVCVCVCVYSSYTLYAHIDDRDGAIVDLDRGVRDVLIQLEVLDALAAPLDDRLVLAALCSEHQRAPRGLVRGLGLGWIWQARKGARPDADLLARREARRAGRLQSRGL